MEKALIYSFLAISIGANIVQQYKIGNYGMYSDLMNQKDSFTQNGYSELLISHLNGLKTEQMEVAKNQGKIENDIFTFSLTLPLAIGTIGGFIANGFIGLFTGAIILTIVYNLLMKWLNLTNNNNAILTLEEETMTSEAAKTSLEE